MNQYPQRGPAGLTSIVCVSRSVAIALMSAALTTFTVGAPVALGAAPDAQGAGQGERATADGVWTFLDAMPDGVLKGPAWDRPFKARAVRLDLERLQKILTRAPMEDSPRAQTEPLMVELPNPDGVFERFNLVESPVFQPGLAVKFPQIKSYLINGLDDGTATGRMIVSPEGVHLRVINAAASAHITPTTRGDNRHHNVYWASDYAKEAPRFVCHTTGEPLILTGNGPVRRFGRGDRGTGGGRSGQTRSLYDLALSTTAEYTRFASPVADVPTVMTTLAAVTASLNVVYERDFATRFMLVTNNNLLVQVDASADPYTNPNSAGATNSQNQANTDAIIGASNYDFGHVLHYLPPDGANGLAGGIGVVCIDGLKGRGYSATDDNQMLVSPFAIDYIAHEMGHQFGGRHVFNNCSGGPGDQIELAREPGSGSTIMSYAGICQSNNIQNNNDPLFNVLNFEQMYSYLSTGPGAVCSTLVATGNNPPSVDAGPDYYIPVRTAFELVATGSDPDNDMVTYSWEQQDFGPPLFIPIALSADNGFSPICRNYVPTTSPRRTVPRLSKLLGANPMGGEPAELVPQVDREMHWTVVARDNRAGSGGVAIDEMVLNVIGFAGPFSIVSPNGGGSAISGITTILWNVANTSFPPIDCQNVRITLSTDGGNSFPIELLASTPNTGSASVVLPALNSTTARIKVQAVGNIFFDMSDANFSISTPVSGVAFSQSGSPVVNDNAGNGNGNSVADPGETAVQLFVPIINGGSTAATGVTGTLVSNTSTVTVVNSFVNYPALPYGAVNANTQPFVLSISSMHPCGGAISLRLTINSNQGSGSGGGILNFTLPTGIGAGLGSAVTFNYVGPPLPIPDNDAVGIDVPINVTGLGVVGDVDVRFGGSPCSDLPDDPFVGLAHTFVGDLRMTLTSPQGTTITLMNRPGGGTTGSSGNNFCQTRLDDDGLWAGIQTIAPAGAPYSTNFKPVQALSAFDGQNGNGTWILKIADVNPNDVGVLRFVSLLIRPNNLPTCASTRATGACCVGTDCTIDNQVNCGVLTGTYRGNNVACSPNPCPAATGACCLGSTCAVTQQAACTGQFVSVGSTCNAPGNQTTPCCKADFNKAAGVTVQDVFDFLSAWFSADARADFNGGGISVQDVFDFLAAWFAGCP